MNKNTHIHTPLPLPPATLVKYAQTNACPPKIQSFGDTQTCAHTHMCLHEINSLSSFNGLRVYALTSHHHLQWK